MSYTGSNPDGYNKLIALGYSPTDATYLADSTKPNPHFYPQYRNDDPVAAGNPNYTGGVRMANGQDAMWENGKLISIDGQPFTSPTPPPAHQTSGTAGGSPSNNQPTTMTSNETPTSALQKFQSGQWTAAQYNSWASTQNGGSQSGTSGNQNTSNSGGTQYAGGLAPDDPSNKFNTATGQPNPKYNGGSGTTGGTTQYANGLAPDDPSNKYNTATGQLNPKYTGTSSDQSGGTAKTYPTTGSPNLDALQTAYSNWISGSIAQGFTINPGLSINNNTVAQFLTETASQLEPQFQQALTKEISDVNSSLGNSVNQYLQSQGQTVQDFQASLANQRNEAGASGMYLGGGERALEQGLANSANRKLSSLQSGAELDIGNQLRAGGQQLGQGFGGANAFGANIPGVSGSANSLNVPNLYGANVSLGGGNTAFAGSSNPGNALNFNYNPSTYQYGAIPGQFATDFSNLLNTTGQNYLKGQAATGAYNVTSQYGNQLGLTV
jgi:hypothetical protein